MIFQKIDPLRCTPEVLFLAVAHIEHELKRAYVQGEGGEQVPASILANCSDYFTMMNVPGIHSEVQFSVNDRDKWAELGLAIQHLYHDQHVNGQNDDKGLMMMNGRFIFNQDIERWSTHRRSIFQEP